MGRDGGGGADQLGGDGGEDRGRWLPPPVDEVLHRRHPQEDSDERGQLRMLLDRYLADQGVAETKEEVFEAGGPIERPFKFDGRVAVS